MWAKSALLSAILTAGVLGTPDVSAQPRPHRPPAAEQGWTTPVQYGGRGQEDVRPIREVVEELRAQYGGDYVSHRLEQGGSPVYVVRWRMPDGQIRDFRVSASR